MVEPEELLPVALELAYTLAARAPPTVREAKRVIDDGAERDLGHALTEEQLALDRLFASDDARERIRAFVEKRDPSFTGR